MVKIKVEEREVLTELFGGELVLKDDPRIEVCGIIDEANSMLGLARSLTKNDRVSGIIYQIQQELLAVAAECATPSSKLHKLRHRITSNDVRRLKQLIDELEKDIPPAKGFVIPGSSPSSAALHVARTIVRRAERAAIRLRRKGQVSRDMLAYMNQLSNLLFSLARFEAAYTRLY